MKNTSLNISFKNGLVLDDPFIIASSHLTDSINAFENLAPISPSAITTKTISQRFGGDRFTQRPARVLRQINSWSGYKIGLYADGPKETELWGINMAYDLLLKAKEILPRTKIGISILQGEDYSEIRNSLGDDIYDFVELNLKYSLRLTEDKKKNLAKVITEIKTDITNFCKTFEDFPKFIKVGREAYSFFTELFISNTLNIINDYKAAVIIANSKKMDGPPSYVRFKKSETLQKGVIVGDYLFPETYNIIKEFYKLNKDIEIVANGGIMSIGEVLDCMTFGIKSFQICTLLHRKGIYVIEMLRRQLKSCIKNFNCKNLVEFVDYVKKNPADLQKVNDLFISKDELTRIIQSEGLEFIKNSLLNEIDSNFKALKTEKIVYDDLKINFIGTKGSILSYFISFYLTRYKGYRITIDVSKSIANSNQFDVAIVSNAYLREFKKQNPNNFLFYKIGMVKYGLMAITADLSKINRVFLFESAGSEEARSEVLKYYKFLFEYIKPEELAPLLIGWDESIAILAKYPLTNFYKYLMPKDVQNQWQEIYSVSKPIWICCRNKSEINNKVIADLNHLINDIPNDIDNAILNFLNFGFNEYLIELLMEKQ